MDSDVTDEPVNWPYQTNSSSPHKMKFYKPLTAYILKYHNFYRTEGADGSNQHQWASVSPS